MYKSWSKWFLNIFLTNVNRASTLTALTSGTHAGRSVRGVFRFVLVRVVRVVVVRVLVVLFALPLDFLHFSSLILKPNLHHPHTQARVFGQRFPDLWRNRNKFKSRSNLVRFSWISGAMTTSAQKRLDRRGVPENVSRRQKGRLRKSSERFYDDLLSFFKIIRGLVRY